MGLKKKHVSRVQKFCIATTSHVNNPTNYVQKNNLNLRLTRRVIPANFQGLLHIFLIFSHIFFSTTFNSIAVDISFIRFNLILYFSTIANWQFRGRKRFFFFPFSLISQQILFFLLWIKNNRSIMIARISGGENHY